jgi:hypothetical protein
VVVKQAACLLGVLNLVSDVKALVPVHHVWYNGSTTEAVAHEKIYHINATT